MGQLGNDLSRVQLNSCSENLLEEKELQVCVSACICVSAHACSCTRVCICARGCMCLFLHVCIGVSKLSISDSFHHTYF